MIETDATPPPSLAAAPGYRVLARKYRPASFAGLIGQEAMVRTLTNAFRSGRVAQAYMLSGVRGIGKTTTARIIARALNCVGPDGGGGPTPEPCGVCEHCRAIAEDRHIDVVEMDAASRTGVDDIRELIEGVRYRPTSARYKVYIIDEVHMLSRNAFNALLKTLEEPPGHVRFVFATTEIRKVPVTVLSRCQRFDLRRVDATTLAAHFAAIVRQEGADVTPPALQLIARAADGSVRDGLSLLDQAIAHAGGTVDEKAVREMLGLADRQVVFDLLEAVMRGEIRAALALFAEQYAAGAEPAVVVEDMLELTHWLTRIKVVPEAADAPEVAEAERVRGRQMAAHLAMAELSRAWQMLLKGLGEVRTAPSPVEAAEMVLVRLAYAARLPTPAEALQALEALGVDGTAAAGHPAPGHTTTAAAPATGPSQAAAQPPELRAVDAPPPGGPGGAVAVRTVARTETRPLPQATDPRSFREVVELVAAAGEPVLHGELLSAVHLVRFEPGRLEIRIAEPPPADLARRLSRFLNEHTARRWLVTVSRAAGEETLREQERAATAARTAEAAGDPLVRAILATFPGARIARVRERSAAAPGTGEQR